MNVRYIAKLANLNLNSQEEPELGKAFDDTLKTVATINELDTSDISPAYQVTGLTNITRQDQVETGRINSKEQILRNVKHTENGLIIVPPVFDEY